MRGAVLDRLQDPVLQTIVADATALMRSRWSAITLCVDAALVFRAYDAPPSELTFTYRIPSRDSWCERVVETGEPLEICSANVDLTGAADLRRLMGVVAYLGMPLEIEGITVGALCTHDTKPRHFDRELLLKLARFASERLAALVRAPGLRSRQLVELAARPALAELRNAVTPIEADLTVTRELLEELSAEHQRTWLAIAESRQALASTVQRFRSSVAAVDEQVRALHLLSESTQNVALGEIVEASSLLARHHTALIGGVRWSISRAERTLSVPVRTSLAVVSSALSLIAQALHVARTVSGIDATIRHSEATVEFELRSEELTPGAIAECRATIAALLEADDVELACGEHTLVLAMHAA